MHSFSVNIGISQPLKVMFTVLGLTYPDGNLKRMHQLYNESTTKICHTFLFSVDFSIIRFRFFNCAKRHDTRVIWKVGTITS